MHGTGWADAPVRRVKAGGRTPFLRGSHPTRLFRRRKKSQRRQRGLGRWGLFASAAHGFLCGGGVLVPVPRTLLALAAPSHPSIHRPRPSARTLASIDPAGARPAGAGGLRCRHWRGHRVRVRGLRRRQGHSMDRSSRKQRLRLQSVRRRLVLDRYSCCSIHWHTESARSFSWAMIISLYMILLQWSGID